VTGLGPTERARLDRFGPLVVDGDWLSAASVHPDEVPDLVAAIVAAGGRVHAVEQRRETLEERFFSLVARETSPDAPRSMSDRSRVPLA
jgi:hypothetical protein